MLFVLTRIMLNHSTMRLLCTMTKGHHVKTHMIITDWNENVDREFSLLVLCNKSKNAVRT